LSQILPDEYQEIPRLNISLAALVQLREEAESTSR
jgi:hypothetical protein